MFSVESVFIEILVVEVNESIVKDIELIAGILDLESAFPQYLIKAKFGCAIAVTSFNFILKVKINYFN